MTALLRNWRTSDALKSAIIRVVEQSSQGRCETRLAALAEAAVGFVKSLLGEEVSSHLWQTTSRGELKKTTLFLDLEAICAAVDSGPGDSSSLVHWCHVSESSPAHLEEGLLVGGPCCAGRGQSVQRTVAPLLNWLIHRPWTQSASSRWTYVSLLLNKIIIGFVAKNVLTEALLDLKFMWSINDTLAAELAAIVASGQENYSVARKLRLLKVCQCFCRPSSREEVSIVVQTLLVVDKILYDVLGDGQRPRATLASLLSEDSSCMSVSKQGLLSLLEGWGGGVAVPGLFF